MTDHLQPGQHPDADQLSAFAEHALPPHEQQQTLAHLAQCAQCRGIVYLAQQADEQPLTTPIAAPKPWFSGWAVAWPLSAALACLLLIAIYVRFNSFHPTENPSNTVATNAPTPPLIPPPTPPAKQLTTHSARPHASQSTPTAAPPNAPMGEIAQPSNAALLAGKSVQDLPITGRNFAATPPSQLASSAPPNTKSAMESARSGSANQLHSTPATADAAGLSAMNDAPAGSASATAPAPAPIGPAAGSVEVSADAQVIVSAPPNQPATSRLELNLPSHLRPVSTAINARLVLAIDTAGTLFLSRDSGKHWKIVTPRWTGHAVRLDSAFSFPRVEPNAPPHSTPLTAKTQAATAGAIRPPDPASAPPGTASLAGAVTDRTGAVIPNARVVVTNIATSQSLTTMTNDAGHYAVQGLASGAYKVQALARGFQTEARDGIVVSASQQSLANFALTVGSETQTVSVQADSLAIETESSLAAVTISGEKPADAHPAAFELTTDTGQVWISSDGRHWKRK